MKIKKQLIKREIAGDVILVPIGQTVLDNNGLFVLNELASFIWDLLPQVDTPEEICARVVAAYDVSGDEAMRDITEFLNKLRKLEII